MSLGSQGHAGAMAANVMARDDVPQRSGGMAFLARWAPFAGHRAGPFRQPCAHRIVCPLTEQLPHSDNAFDSGVDRLR